MKAGEQPITPAHTDDDSSYGLDAPIDPPDVHQLAMEARRKREVVSERQKAWNQAVQVCWHVTPFGLLLCLAS